MMRLSDELGPVSRKMLAELLRECGRPLAPLVEGVRQEDFHQLERTLLTLAQLYQEAGNNVEQRRRIRACVLEAKQHAGWVARNPKVDAEKRAQKEEMALWMLTWLENPLIFGQWLGLRKNRLSLAPETRRESDPHPDCR